MQLELTGRLLFFCDDEARMRAQLGGRDLAPEEAGPLRSDISTDEITPVPSLTWFDERLGRHVYTGYKAGEGLPVGVDAVRAGGFSVVVAGRRYGKGSSREHSPVAERHAGIRLVIAESFERIYRQNADNVGLFTSTDLGLVERIRRGEPVEIEELVASRESLSAAILRAGGLLRYGVQHMGAIRPLRAEAAPGPQTLAEKILARHYVTAGGAAPAGLPQPGQGAFVRADWRFIIEVYTPMAAHLLGRAFGEDLVLQDPASIVAFAEHFSYTHRSPAHLGGQLLPGIRVLNEAHEAFATRHGITSHGWRRDREGSEGICHPMMTERYALPGQVVAGTDSHTPHAGALGCLAFGVGTTDMANAMRIGAVRLTVPESIRVEFAGKPAPGITAKDMVLKLLAEPAIRRGDGVGKVFEFCGEGVRALDIDERATLTNMAAELGGFTGIVAPDAQTVRFLHERRGIAFSLEDWMRSDEGARYAAAITIDCAALSPMVAAPGDPGNGVPLAGLTERPRLDLAYAGTCTGGKRADFDHYHAVLAWALAHGRRVAPGVQLYLQFGTAAVRDYCAAQGYLSTFEAVGATVLEPACGACANLGPGASERRGQVTVSAQNRNFPGRSGPGQVWLASPPTVVASAIAGRLVSFAELQAGVG